MKNSGTFPKTSRSSRRDFLKATAAGATVLSGLSITRSAHAAGSETIKIGMIGSGSRCSGARFRQHAGRAARETGGDAPTLRSESRPLAGT